MQGGGRGGRSQGGGGTRPFRKEVVPGLLDPRGRLGVCWSRRRELSEGLGLEGPWGGCGVEGFGDSGGYGGDFTAG